MANYKELEKKSMAMYNKLYSVNKVRIQERAPVEFISGIDPAPYMSSKQDKVKIFVFSPIQNFKMFHSISETHES